MPGPCSFRRGSRGAWGRGGYAPSLRPCRPQALLSSVSVGAGYALPPPPRLGVPWPQIQGIQPLFHAHEKGSLGWPARLVLRARRYSRNSGGGRTTVAPGTGGRGYLRQLFYDGSRSLPPFFGWRQARGWIAGRALRGQRAGPGGRAAERGRVGAPTDEMMQLFFDWRMWQSHFALTVKNSNKKFKKNYGLL